MNDDEIIRLIERAHSGESEALGILLQRQEGRLYDWAEKKLGGGLHQRAAPSDVLQMTFLEAYRDFAAFRGSTEVEFVGWLRQILEHNAATTVRDHTLAAKRSIRREKPIAGECDPALTGQNSSPSHRAARVEEAMRLARALQKLPIDQREAVQLRHLEGRSLEEIATRMNRTNTAVAGLIKRGMMALREHLRKGELP